jgi:hypothetical protein
MIAQFLSRSLGLSVLVAVFSFLSGTALQAQSHNTHECGDYSTLSNGLVAYYPFNGDFNDYSGNGNNLSKISSGAILTTDQFGNSNRALFLTSSTD